MSRNPLSASPLRAMPVFILMLLLTACDESDSEISVDIRVFNVGQNANISFTVDGPLDAPKTITLPTAAQAQPAIIPIRLNDDGRRETVRFTAQQGALTADVTCRIADEMKDAGWGLVNVAILSGEILLDCRDNWMN